MNERTGDIKIGTSGDPTGRLKSLQTGCPDRLILIGAIAGSRVEEKALHARYGRLRKPGGEWFVGDPGLRRDVETMVGSGVAPEATGRARSGGASRSDRHIAVGLFFHTFDADGDVEYQGRIIRVGDGLVLGQLMSWWDGMPTVRKLFPVGDLASWRLYDDAEQMRRGYGKLVGMSHKDMELSEEVTNALDRFVYREKLT